MPTGEVGAPSGFLYRIGTGDPTAWPLWDRVGDGRFDDPTATRYRVLYAGERRACFVETLARFRPPPARLLDRTLLPPEVSSVVGRIPLGWLSERRIARFVLHDAGQVGRWLDLREPATHQVLRRELAGLLVGLEFTDFDISTATSSERALTQPIGRWAYERGYRGIVYASRFDARLTCYAIFEHDPGIRLAQITREPLTFNDPDLRAVAALFGLSLSVVP